MAAYSHQLRCTGPPWQALQSLPEDVHAPATNESKGVHIQNYGLISSYTIQVLNVLPTAPLVSQYNSAKPSKAKHAQR